LHPKLERYDPLTGLPCFNKRPNYRGLPIKDKRSSQRLLYNCYYVQKLDSCQFWLRF
jgi:hypothetical protein